MSSRTLKIAFILDPLELLKPYKDSSIAMMREATRRGHAVFAIRREALAWRDGVVSARATALAVSMDDPDWYQGGEVTETPLAAFDAVVMRQDPPFDFEYVAATWLLERAVAGGARVFNHSRSIRDHSEKVAITEFAQFTATTIRLWLECPRRRPSQRRPVQNGEASPLCDTSHPGTKCFCSEQAAAGTRLAR